jgi:cobalamin biosynthesis protein CbiD
VIDREDDAAAVIIYVSMATTGLAEPMYRREYIQKFQCIIRLSNKLVSKELVI